MQITAGSNNYTNLIHLTLEKREYILYFLSYKGFKISVENQALSCLHGEVLKITLTVPVKLIVPFKIWQIFNCELT